MKEFIRKIIQNGRQTYYINIPKDIMRGFKWKERQKLVIKKYGNKIVISDWKK